MAQLPDVAQQYVIYGRVSNTAFAILFTIGLAFWIKGILWFWKKSDEADEYAAVIFLGGGGMAFLVGMNLVAWNAALLVWLAPKVWLIKEIAGLLK
jgi:hypothetical protein